MTELETKIWNTVHNWCDAQSSEIPDQNRRYLMDEMKALVLSHVSKSLPDHYAGELNTKRIKAYKVLHEQYNLEKGTVRDIFCKGADWYKEQCQKGNVC